MDFSVSLIVAHDSNYGIGKNNTIPWSFKEDTVFFQDITKFSSKSKNKNIVIYGANTWFSLPWEHKGLKDRINIIISSSLTPEQIKKENITQSEVYLVNSLETAIYDIQNKVYGEIDNVFICGGQQVYKSALELEIINNLYITQIDYNYECDKFIDKDLLNKLQEKLTNVKSKKFNIGGVDITFSKYTIKNKDSENTEENNYLDLLHNILTKGNYRQTRNEYTYSLFGKTLEFDLSKGFPLLTTKKMFFKGVVEELLWFLKGDTNSNNLSKKGVNIWKDNTTQSFLEKNNLPYKVGDIGPMYGFQLKHFGAEYKGMDESYENQGYNQIDYCLDLIKNDPHSRRIIMTTYNPAQAKEGVLYPCHGVSIIFNVEDNKLSCMMTQRSADFFLGVPFNIASYALLVHLFVEVINNSKDTKNKLEVGRLIMNFGDSHIYRTHYNECIRQVLRTPMAFPTIKFNKKIDNLEEINYEDISLVNYIHHPSIVSKMVA